MSDDDRPVEISIETLKKTNKKRRFVDSLPENLKEMYNEEVKKTIKPRDPRFDPKVAGSCRPDQIEFYKDKQTSLIKDMTEKLSDKNLSDEERAKCKLIITQFKQKLTNLKQKDVKSKFLSEINSSYVKDLEEGKFPKLLKKKEIRSRMKEHINLTKTAKSIEKSGKKKEFRKLKRETFLESKIK